MPSVQSESMLGKWVRLVCAGVRVEEAASAGIAIRAEGWKKMCRVVLRE